VVRFNENAYEIQVPLGSMVDCGRGNFRDFEPALGVAHARLLQTDPPKRSALSTAPKLIRPWFNEAIEPTVAKVQ
jgi:hypothetical protein